MHQCNFAPHLSGHSNKLFFGPRQVVDDAGQYDGQSVPDGVVGEASVRAAG